MANYHISQEKINFSFWNYNKGILFDEKKKRFVDFADMDLDTYLNYRKTFTNYRPDLYGRRANEYDSILYRIGTHLLERMYNQRKQEMARCFVLFRSTARNYNLPLLEHHIKMGEVDKPNSLKYLNWRDASLSVAYLEYVLARVSRYGLHWGALKNRKFPDYKQKIRSDEDELVDYFVYEMRKAPVKRAEVPAMS